eukprot:scaffold52065_cov16-Tisochrysis_lutea.AAC.1
MVDSESDEFIAARGSSLAARMNKLCLWWRQLGRAPDNALLFAIARGKHYVHKIPTGDMLPVFLLIPWNGPRGTGLAYNHAF